MVIVVTGVTESLLDSINNHLTSRQQDDMHQESSMEGVTRICFKVHNIGDG